MIKRFLIIILCLSFPLLAETDESSENVENLETAPETKAEVVTPPVAKKPWVGKLISVSARVDTAYTGGGAVAQGFSIPSLRLTAFGEAGEAIDYRLSLAQTREYSSTLLSQIIPSEAYLDLSTNPVRNNERKNGSNLRLRVGLFAPLLNPWWTPDLSELSVPDYAEVYKSSFPNHDMGAELLIEPFGENFQIALAALNGSGTTALNTNNSKAFSGHIHVGLPFSNLKIGIGNGSYYMEQSSRGSINYKRNWISDFFVYLNIESIKTSLQFDTFLSEYEDTTRAITPTGYTATGILGLSDWLGVFSRYEYGSNTPLKGRIQSFQAGPSLMLSDYAKAFVIFQALKISGNEERSIFVRLRVSI